jgi:hypothetical protein
LVFLILVSPNLLSIPVIVRLIYLAVEVRGRGEERDGGAYVSHLGRGGG